MSLRDSLHYIAIRGASGALAVLSLSVFVRTLGPSAYAELSLGLAAAALVSSFLVMPLNTTLARLYGEVALRAALLKTLRGLLWGACSLLLLGALVLEGCGLSWLAPGVLVAAACFAVWQACLDFSAQAANAALAPARYARILLLRALAVLILGCLAIRLGLGAKGVLWSMALACAGAVCLAGWEMQRDWRPGFDRRAWQRIARFSAPFFVTCGMNYALQWGDRYLLQLNVDAAALGRYSALSDFVQQSLTLLATGLCSAWYPRIVQAWGAGEQLEGRQLAQRLYGHYARTGVLLFLPAALLLACALAPLAALLFGPAWQNLPPALGPLLVLGASLGAMKNFFFDVPVLLAERVWRQALGLFLSAALAWGAMAVLVPRSGVVGAALGIVIGQLFGLLWSWRLGRGVL